MTYLNVARAISIGSIKSIPYIVKGHSEVINVSFFGCDMGILENFWHLSHFLAVNGISVHHRPEISLPQGLVSQGLPPSVIAADPLMDLSMYVVPFLEVDTLQKRG